MSQRRKRRRSQSSAERHQSRPITPLVTATDLAPESSLSEPQRTQTRAITSNDVRLIRRDLLKVFVVLVAVVGVLVGLIVSNQSTGWLDRAADTLYTWLRLGEQK